MKSKYIHKLSIGVTEILKMGVVFIPLFHNKRALLCYIHLNPPSTIKIWKMQTFFYSFYTTLFSHVKEFYQGKYIKNTLKFQLNLPKAFLIKYYFSKTVNKYLLAASWDVEIISNNLNKRLSTQWENSWKIVGTRLE